MRTFPCVRGSIPKHQFARRTPPSTPSPRQRPAQLIQHRNFFNPELDGNLTPYLRWMKGSLLSWLAPDDLRFRAASWGFYDGIYDYGSSQFNTAQRKINDSFNPAVPPGPRTGGWFIESPSINTNAITFPEMFSGFATKKPRPTYADQARINELYLSYTKGRPSFALVGNRSPGVNQTLSRYWTKATRLASCGPPPAFSRMSTKHAFRCGPCEQVTACSTCSARSRVVSSNRIGYPGILTSIRRWHRSSPPAPTHHVGKTHNSPIPSSLAAGSSCSSTMCPRSYLRTIVGDSAFKP